MAEAGAEKTALSPKRAVFMGSPEFAAIVLRKVHASPLLDLCAVYTQPDRPAGRGQRPAPPAAALAARELGIPLLQPERLREKEALAEFSALRPDVLVVAAYGLIIPEDFLDLPAFGALNVHASLLPAYRGAAPVARAIMENYAPGAKTGVSIMGVVPALDAGPVYASISVPIGRHDCASLTRLLASEGADLLLESMPAIFDGENCGEPQDDGASTYAPKLVKAEAALDFSMPAAEVDARIRGLTPWPGARTHLEINGAHLDCLIVSARPAVAPCDAQPGTIWRGADGLYIVCGDGAILVDGIKPAGKRVMTGDEFANGRLGRARGACGHAD